MSSLLLNSSVGVRLTGIMNIFMDNMMIQSGISLFWFIVDSTI